jgi:hypothetical protein
VADGNAAQAERAVSRASVWAEHSAPAKAISRAESDTRIKKASGFPGSSDRTRLEDGFKVAVRKDALPDVNLWWDDGLYERILCSHALRDAVVAAGLKSIPLIGAREI